MFDLTYARELVVGDVVIFGEREGNQWKITELRDTAPGFRGYTAEYVGVKSRYSHIGEVGSGSLRAAGLYRKVAQVTV